MDGPRGRLVDGDVRVGGDARQRYYDSRGYGRPLEGNDLLLSPVEAAHLLYRGDIGAVEGERGGRTEADPDAGIETGEVDMGFRAFVGRIADADPDFPARFLVYADLRERGFYLSPAREGWIEELPANADFAVYERGSGPWDGEPYTPFRVVGERADLPATDLEPGVLAVVDEESEVTYFEVERPAIDGDSATLEAGRIEADLLADRVIVWEAPERLFGECFYGQPLAGRRSDRSVVQLSLVEAAYLVGRDALAVRGGSVLDRGRSVEGERFDRRLAVYADLRERGTVPKTGFKFGADFRVYADVESVDELGHSERLVRVLSPDHVLSPRDLALDVRLAHGVRKEMAFALADEEESGIEWSTVGRITP